MKQIVAGFHIESATKAENFDFHNLIMQYVLLVDVT